MRTSLLARALVLLAFVLPVAAPAQAAETVVGNGTPASCTEMALASALTIGGAISFNCGSSAFTIAINSEKLIGKDTTLDGGGLITLRGNGSTRILRSVDGVFDGNIVKSVMNVTLIGLTIENGNTADQGGGMRVGFWNNFVLRDSTLLNNRASKDTAQCDGGGALFIGGGSVALIERSAFRGNRANNGGAINSLRTNLTISDSTFEENQAIHTATINQQGDCGGGGAVYIDGSRNSESGGPGPMQINNSRFMNNSTNNHGGALFVGLYPNESLSIDRSLFEGNIVTKEASASWSGTGGGIWYGSATGSANNATFRLTNSTLANNKATSQGGGLWTSAPVTIANATFSGNDATNSAISDPENWQRGNGGALAVNNNAAVTITNATFAANHAGFNGGAIAGKTVTLRNTLFANNTSDWPIKIMQHCTDALTDAGNNMQFPDKNPNPNYWNETSCTNVITIADPKLAALADNGGPTPTLALSSGSPAIGAGNPATCMATDQRGVSRSADNTCDIGAYELVMGLTSISPALVRATTPGITLTVTGAGFTATSQVLVNSNAVTTEFVNSTMLKATLPASLLVNPGTLQVSVSGSLLPARSLVVAAFVGQVYLPLVRR